MLKVLRKLLPSERSRLLVAAVDLMTPRPRLDAPEPGTPSPDLVKKLLTEVREAVRVRENDTSAEAQWLVRQFLSQLMEEMLLETRKKPLVRERLGADGTLELQSYRRRLPVTQGSPLLEIMKRSGTSVSEIDSVLKQPDAVEHRPLREQAPFDLTFLARTVRGEDPFTLLVEADRARDELNVSQVWRIFHSELDLKEVRTPFQLLNAFLRRFGRPFNLGSRPPTLFIEYDAVPISSLGMSRAQVEAALRGDGPPLVRPVDTKVGDDLWGSSRIRVSPLGVLEVFTLYVVDLGSYLGALQAHGVPVILRPSSRRG